MSHALIFLPDISGFTKFIQSTEISHSQYIISELLELLIDANTLGLELAEIEGDALFFYKTDPLPSYEHVQEQIDKMLSVFYSQLHLFKTHRICPCRACISAPELDLKFILHYGPIDFLTIKNKCKPFGKTVIQAHRLMKNTVDSDKYILMSRALMEQWEQQLDSEGTQKGADCYDGEEINYLYRLIDPQKVQFVPHPGAEEVEFHSPPSLIVRKHFPTSAANLLEHLSNYSLRIKWTKGLDEIVYQPNLVTRVGVKHTCVINAKQLNFVTVSKRDDSGALIYGEKTDAIPLIERCYLFYHVTAIDDVSCDVKLEIYLESDTLLGKIFRLFAPLIMKGTLQSSITSLHHYMVQTQVAPP